MIDNINQILDYYEKYELINQYRNMNLSSNGTDFPVEILNNVHSISNFIRLKKEDSISNCLKKEKLKNSVNINNFKSKI